MWALHVGVRGEFGSQAGLQIAEGDVSYGEKRSRVSKANLEE